MDRQHSVRGGGMECWWTELSAENPYTVGEDTQDHQEECLQTGGTTAAGVPHWIARVILSELLDSSFLEQELDDFP